MLGTVITVILTVFMVALCIVLIVDVEREEAGKTSWFVRNEKAVSDQHGERTSPSPMIY